MCRLRIPSRRPRARAAGGFSLIDVLIAVVVLSLGLMAHTASAVSEQRLAREQASRSQAHQAIRQLLERMRADENWATLYTRLRTLQVNASLVTGTALRLDDGRIGYSPQTYYPAFRMPPNLGTVLVLVDVPGPPVGGAYAFDALREDVTAPQFALPSDLNGDGVIDSLSHANDYEALPVVVTFHWTPPGEGSREIKVATWLRGDR
jgi:type II secretory pathway pseudopilin PulG